MNRARRSGYATISALAVGLAVAIVLAGCGPASDSASHLGSRGASQKVTQLRLLSSFWHGFGLVGPPLTTSCSEGGREVTLRGAFGPERAEIQPRGLRPGKHYAFYAYQSPISATVRVAQTGPVGTQTKSKEFTDFLGHSNGLEGNGSGTLSVAANGRSGSLRVTLPKGDAVSGHWTCGSSHLLGVPSRPTLLPATAPSVENKCALGSPNSNPPRVVTCPDGDLNVEAWQGSGSVEAAGPRATASAVQATLCRDQATLVQTTPPAQTTPDLEYEYSVAAVYYEWKFPITPAAIVASANCAG